MDYEARLLHDNRILKKQMISGTAERFRLWGLKQADTVMSEIMTDMVNRLDVAKMFREAHL